MLPGSQFPMPQAVLQTASLATSLSESLEIATVGSPDQVTFVYMYFTEIQQLGSNEIREFSIYGNNKLFFNSYRPTINQEDLLFTQPPGKPGGLTYSLRATVNSTLPPIINAVEIFTLVKMPLLPTSRSDGDSLNFILHLFWGFVKFLFSYCGILLHSLLPFSWVQSMQSWI